jgi:hypothetical protein
MRRSRFWLCSRVTLVVPELSDRLTRRWLSSVDACPNPLTATNRRAASGRRSWLGVATGLLWAPCAGPVPVLGHILTGTALPGANVETTLLLLAYAAGAATSLGLALILGGRVFAATKRSLGAGEWVRRGLSTAVLAAVAAIFIGVDTGFPTQISLANTASLEQGLVDRFHRAAEEGGAQPSSSVVMNSGAMMSANPSMTMSVNGPMAMSANQAATMKATRTAGSFAGRGFAAVAFRRGRVAQLAAADARAAQRQGGAGRLLDLPLLQLPALDPLCPGLGGQVQGQGLVVIGVARAGICLSKSLSAT